MMKVFLFFMIPLIVVLACFATRFPPAYITGFPFSQWNVQTGRAAHARKHHATIHDRLTHGYGLDVLEFNSYAWIVRRQGNEVSNAIVFVHGLGQSRAEFADFMPILFDKCPTCVAMLVDLPGCGENTAFQAGIDYGLCNHEFLETAILRIHVQFKPAKLFLFGMSGGATSALNTLLFTRANISGGVIALAPFFDLETVIGEKLAHVKGGILPFRIARVLGRMVYWMIYAGSKCHTPRQPSFSETKDVKSPVLLIHGQRDKVVPWTHSLAIKNTFQGNISLCSIPSAYHVTTQLYLHTQCLDAIFAFLNAK